MKPNIILTFDYEIFFGEKSGTFENCIYKPVEKLRKVMNEENIKGIFFIDILYYIKMLEYPELEEIRVLMKQQIQDLLRDGHDIELHLHPHWINSSYEKGEWKFKYSKYRFEQLTLSERDEVFEKGVNYLLEICKEVKENYEINGYRAGGWCIQPFEIFYPYFKKYGLKYDSSVMDGKQAKGIGHKFNFTKLPNKLVYRFGKSIELEDINGEFIEYKISNFNYTIFDKILNKIKNYRKKDKQFGDGIGMKLNSSNSVILSKLKVTKANYSLEFPNLLIIDKKLEKENKESIVFVSHPKSMTEESIKYLKILKNKKYKFIKYE